VKSILPQQEFKNALLKYKTGTGDYKPGHYIAWLVGYVVKVQSIKAKVQSEENEEEKNVYFFAFNVDAKTFDEAVELRSKIKSEMLEYLGVKQYE
jgi:beta-lactamase class D